MRDPTYEELLAVVKQIAGFIYDGDEVDGEEHEMSIDDAFETCAACRDLTRNILGTDGTDLPIPLGSI
jgi:hypothetical protein